MKLFMDITEKEQIIALTRQNGGEWTLNHTGRLLRLVEQIGAGIPYNAEVVWMAAHLHDWGAYAPWLQEGVDHAARSGEVARGFLAERGYAPAFIQAVLECITTHHQGDPNRRIEAILLSDADALDFLGVMGVLREFSRQPKDMRKAYENAQKRLKRLPGMLCLETSRQMAAGRVEEMERVLASFVEESFDLF